MEGVKSPHVVQGVRLLTQETVGVREHCGWQNRCQRSDIGRCSQDCSNEGISKPSCGAGFLRWAVLSGQFAGGFLLLSWTGYSTKSSGSLCAEQELALPARSSSSDLSSRAKPVGLAPRRETSWGSRTMESSSVQACLASFSPAAHFRESKVYSAWTCGGDIQPEDSLACSLGYH